MFSLVVKLGQERVGRVVPEDRGVGHAGTGRSRGRGPNVGRGREAEELFYVGDLAGQGISRITLALPGDGGLTHAGHALCSSGSGCDKGGSEGGGGTRGVRRRWGGETRVTRERRWRRPASPARRPWRQWPR